MDPTIMSPAAIAAMISEMDSVQQKYEKLRVAFTDVTPTCPCETRKREKVLVGLDKGLSNTNTLRGMLMLAGDLNDNRAELLETEVQHRIKMKTCVEQHRMVPSCKY